MPSSLPGKSLLDVQIFKVPTFCFLGFFLSFVETLALLQCITAMLFPSQSFLEPSVPWSEEMSLHDPPSGSAPAQEGECAGSKGKGQKKERPKVRIHKRPS